METVLNLKRRRNCGNSNTEGEEKNIVKKHPIQLKPNKDIPNHNLKTSPSDNHLKKTSAQQNSYQPSKHSQSQDQKKEIPFPPKNDPHHCHRKLKPPLTENRNPSITNTALPLTNFNSQAIFPVSLYQQG